LLSRFSQFRVKEGNSPGIYFLRKTLLSLYSIYTIEYMVEGEFLLRRERISRRKQV
jgi:hypothetical protein